MEMEVVKYDLNVAVIKELDDKYAGIIIKDAASYAFVMAGLKEYRDRRIELDAWYKEKKKGALEYTNALGAERKKFKLLLEPGEQHLKDVRQVEDDRKQAIKDKAARIEQERVENIQSKIEHLEALILTTTGMSSERVATLCDDIVAIQITEEVYQEFVAKAKEVKLATLSELDDIYNDKVTLEKEAAERKAEIAKIEKLRAEQAEAQAKIDKEKAEAEAKMHEELRKIEAEKQAAQKVIDDEREKLEAEKRAEQEKQDRAEFERKAEERADAQAKRQVEEIAQRKEKENAEATKEAKRKAAMLPDKEKLIAFANMLADIELPRLKNKGAKDILNEISIRIVELSEAIKGQAGRL